MYQHKKLGKEFIDCRKTAVVMSTCLKLTGYCSFRHTSREAGIPESLLESLTLSFQLTASWYRFTSKISGIIVSCETGGKISPKSCKQFSAYCSHIKMLIRWFATRVFEMTYQTFSSSVVNFLKLESVLPNHTNLQWFTGYYRMRAWV